MKPAREEILEKFKRVKHYIPEEPDFKSPVYHSLDGPLDEVFKINLEKIAGSVFIASSESELIDKIKDILQGYTANNICCQEDDILQMLGFHGIFCNLSPILQETIEAGITGCEYLIAHTGSVMVSSAQKGGRQMFVYPPVHIVIARKSQLVGYLEEAYSGIQQKYKNSLPSHIALITGPSRTADIEKTLVMGAHGPKELWVLVY
jgi:L-lactate dehydrogenase complex protein LldG